MPDAHLGAWSPPEHPMMGWELQQDRGEGSDPAEKTSLPDQLYSLKASAVGEEMQVHREPHGWGRRREDTPTGTK